MEENEKKCECKCNCRSDFRTLTIALLVSIIVVVLYHVGGQVLTMAKGDCKVQKDCPRPVVIQMQCPRAAHAQKHFSKRPQGSRMMPGAKGDFRRPGFAKPGAPKGRPGAFRKAGRPGKPEVKAAVKPAPAPAAEAPAPAAEAPDVE